MLPGVHGLHLHLHGLLSLWPGGAGRWRILAAALLLLHSGVEGPHQPVERRVVDQVIHDVVQGVLHAAQLHLAAAQHAVGQLPQAAGGVKAAVHLCGRAAQRQGLLLDVVGEALHAGDQDQTGGLELLCEGACQGQGARFNDLCEETRWRISEFPLVSCKITPLKFQRNATMGLLTKLLFILRYKCQIWYTHC